jgi:purine/pyrimidine-nucleoside phosphorylase
MIPIIAEMSNKKEHKKIIKGEEQMIKVNEYFNGAVKSLSFQAPDGAATVGVMAPGEYEFGTSSREIMSVINGALAVLLPGSDTWAEYSGGESFEVAADSRFKVRVMTDTAYQCLFR